MTFARAVLSRWLPLSSAVLVGALVAAFGGGANRAASAQAPSAPSAAAATPTPTPTPPPPPCKLNIDTTLTVSYGKNVLSGGPKCRLGQLGDAPFDTSSSDDVTGDADLVIKGSNIEIDYEVTQRCVYKTYGVFYNDNVMVQLTWNRGLEPSSQPVPIGTPVVQNYCNDRRVRPALRQATPPSAPGSPTLAPTPTPTSISAPTPTPTPSPTPTPGSGYFVAAADPAQSCQTTVNGMPGDPAQCTAKRTLESVGSGPAAKQVWKGTITLPIAELERAGVPLEFTLMVIRNVYAGLPDRHQSFPPVFTTERVAVTIKTVDTVANQQYIGYVPNAGHSSDTPSHRRGANVYVPMTPYLLASSSLADDSNQPLDTRNKAVKALNASNKKTFACHSCGSFTADDTQPFQSPFTSTDTLGVNLDALGVDALPFTTSSASYPIDAGYKFILLPPPGPNATTAFGVAALHGTTKSSGYATDSVVSIAESVPLTASKLQVGLFHAVANRTVLATPAPGAFPSTTTPLRHSTDTQASIAYAFSPQALHLYRDSLTGAPALSENAPLTYTTLIRYGTQYGPRSQVLDVVESMQKTPPALDPFSAENEKYHFSGALGYRIVGPRYSPIDASFEQHSGQHGPYASLAYNVPVDFHDGFGAGTFALSGYGFSDGVRIRDEAVMFSASYPLSPQFALQSDDKLGHLTVSQVGRANGIVISDALGGGAVLPNSKYNLQLAYTSPGNDAKITGGYTILYAQGCNTKIVVKTQPCYPYRQPMPTADVAWLPFARAKDDVFASSLFVEGSVQGSSTTPFETLTDSVLRTPRFNYYDTTASHVVRTAALGATLFSTKTSCATLLLTTANRGGDVDNFDKSAPTPGFTNTASIEFVPGRGWPSLLAAYSRIENKSGNPPPQTLFTLRAQIGVPFFNFGTSAKGGCGG